MDLVWAVALGLVFVLLVVALIRYSSKRSSSWTVMAEGQFNKVRYERRASPRMGATPGLFSATSFTSTAIIRLLDGNEYEAYGVDTIPAQRGDRIRILVNGFGECRVERAEG